MPVLVVMRLTRRCGGSVAWLRSASATRACLSSSSSVAWVMPRASASRANGPSTCRKAVASGSGAAGSVGSSLTAGMVGGSAAGLAGLLTVWPAGPALADDQDSNLIVTASTWVRVLPTPPFTATLAPTTRPASVPPVTMTVPA